MTQKTNKMANTKRINVFMKSKIGVRNEYVGSYKMEESRSILSNLFMSKE